MNKNTCYWLTLYIIVTALYNLVFTLFIVGIIFLGAYFTNYEVVSFKDCFLSSYCIGYAVLFIINLGVLKDYLKEEINVKKDSIRK